MFAPGAVRRLDAGVPITVFFVGVHPGCMNLFCAGARSNLRRFERQAGRHQRGARLDRLPVHSDHGHPCPGFRSIQEGRTSRYGLRADQVAPPDRSCSSTQGARSMPTWLSFPHSELRAAEGQLPRDRRHDDGPAMVPVLLLYLGREQGLVRTSSSGSSLLTRRAACPRRQIVRDNRRSGWGWLRPSTAIPQSIARAAPRRIRRAGATVKQ